VLVVVECVVLDDVVVVVVTQVMSAVNESAPLLAVNGLGSFVTPSDHLLNKQVP
jgi:hypothetical protein